jgi:lipopolysaccharide transport system ATP-binding protein
MSNVITAENLGKKYSLQHQQREQYTALRDVLAHGVRNLSKRIFSPFTPYRSPLTASEDFWALKDVSFEVKQGDRIGIIGRNGAGKSTLLKILSRITEPTTGSVRIKGRVASLLEVGTGFHPELTGRENIYLNGAILGMGRAEIKKKFDEIVDFAEIEKFLDTPVKRYSSGMYVRLAFAVAAHLEPEILIVDEVLAVNQLCHMGLWLEEGIIKCVAHIGHVVEEYMTSGMLLEGSKIWENSTLAPGNDRIRLRAVRTRNRLGEDSAMLEMEHPFTVEIEYEILTPQAGMRTGFWVYTLEGVLVFVAGDNEDMTWQGTKRKEGIYISCCTIPGMLLNSGHFSISVAADIQGSEMLFLEHHVVSFQIEHTGCTTLDGASRSPGILCPSFNWRISQISGD